MTILNITFGQRPYYSGENFLPIAAGGGREDILSDNQGDNIASKNDVFGELTAVYWAWKNLKDVDMIGMTHYRRYLMSDKGLLGGFIPYTKTFYQITWDKFLKFSYTTEPFRRIIENDKADFIFAKRWHFEGMTVREQYLQHHPFTEDLKLAREILEKHHPESLLAWDSFMSGSGAYCCCLFVCRWKLFDHLCNWMFPMLFEIETRLDLCKYDSYQSRVIAYLYERLLNVYLAYHQYRIYETPFYMIGEGPYKGILRQDLGAKVWNMIRRKKR